MSKRVKIWKYVLFCLLTAGPVLGQSQQEPSTFHGPFGMDWKIDGQISVGIMSIDDGFETHQNLVDNANSGTRIGLRGTRPLGPGTFRFTFETALGTRGSSQISQTNIPSDLLFGRRTLRFLEIEYAAPHGTYALGQGNMASDTAAEVDFSGTGLAAYSFVSGAGGGFSFRDQSGALTPIIVSGVFRNFDGGRRMRIRYDTHEMKGFTLAAALGKEVVNPNDDNTYSDFAIRYGHTHGDFRTGIAIGYGRIETPAGAVSETIIASASALHEPSGFSLTLATGTQQRGSGGSYDYAKLGYQTDRWTTLGDTRLSLDYYAGNDLIFTGSESRSIGLAILQDIDSRGLETFLLLRSYALDSGTATSFRDVSAVFAGARFKF